MEPKPAILVTGAGGQLGRCLEALANRYSNYHFLFADSSTLPIQDEAAVSSFFSRHSIHYCINCAAYTAVDKAETETEKAFAVNAAGAHLLAAACSRAGAVFIHISTDYVFGGNGHRPYTPADATGPVSVYGASKLKGEQLVQECNPGALIIRTSWLYSPYGHNFVKTMLRLMAEKESINVVNDQLGRPTYAPDLAAAIMQIIAGGRFSGGIYHFSNTGEAISWYDFALAIKTLSGSSCLVNPVDTAAYPTAAKRPRYSVLDTQQAEAAFSITIPHWHNGLERCLAALKAC